MNDGISASSVEEKQTFATPQELATLLKELQAENTKLKHEIETWKVCYEELKDQNAANQIKAMVLIELESTLKRVLEEIAVV